MSPALVVHPHFHFRRTGATSHVEAIVTELQKTLPTKTMGIQLRPELPKIGLRELLRYASTGPVIWHAHRNNEMAFGILLRALRRRVKVVYTRHAATKPSWVTRLLMRGADAIVSLTDEVATAVGRPSTVVGHGVNVERFRPVANREAAWTSLGMKGGYGVGVVGRIRPQKGQEDFARAVQPLLGKNPQWRAIVVGRVKPSDQPWADGWLRGTEGFSWVPEQEDVLPWFQGLSIVVQPSRSEGFSLVLLEALASGCCVVAARLPHFPALVKEGVTGFLYEPGNVEELRSILARLMDRPELVAQVGRRAAEDAQERLGVNMEALRLVELYRPLLREEGAPVLTEGAE